MKPIFQKFLVISFWIGAAFLSVLHFSCSKSGKDEKPAVVINSYTLTAQEFKEAFSRYGMTEDTPENRADFLNNLITRKLLLQEGQKRGLDTQKAFLQSIEDFWEQSLLKLVVDQKMKEIAGQTRITQPEIEEYYKKWTQENPGSVQSPKDSKTLVEWRLRKSREAETMENWTNELIRTAHINVDKEALGIK